MSNETLGEIAHRLHAARGIEAQLGALAALAWRKSPEVRVRAHALTDHGIDRQDKIRLIIDDLHRRFFYAPDPVKESIHWPSSDDACNGVDVDDACLVVAAFAMSVGIPCRIVGARYRERCWTCFVAYEDEEGRWVGVDPLRQKTTQVFEELLWIDEGKP